jgi:uncharacterized membrane-anchored protein
VVVAQLALVAAGVAPQLSARLTGEEYRLEVELYDPVDPFRGAYVELSYPGLGERPGSADRADVGDDERGDLYITLVQDGELWRMGEYLRNRPDEGPYLACSDRGWRIRCGIESWFVPEDEAQQLEEDLAEGGAVATVKVDGRGNAAIVGLDPR